MFDEHRLDIFLNTAVSRHLIYEKRKEGLPRPWTYDPILQKYHFCNVFRQYDKCSVWMIENIMKKAKSVQELWPAVIVYRYISSMNIYEALQERCPDLFDMEHVAEVFKELRTTTDIKFNGCFLRNPKVKGGWAPIHEVPFMLVKEIQDDGGMSAVMDDDTFKSLTAYLVQFSATSGFMAHQYCCDLSYSDYWNPTDRYSFATMGPGSKQGMNILLMKQRHDPLKPEEWLKLAKYLWMKLSERMNMYFPDEDVTLQEVQNWLCEFQKYAKYVAMEKHPDTVRVKARKYYGKEGR